MWKNIGTGGEGYLVVLPFIHGWVVHSEFSVQLRPMLNKMMIEFSALVEEDQVSIVSLQLVPM